MKEHSEDSWNDLFGCEDEDRRNYLVYNLQGKVLDTCLTLSEAKSYAEQLNWEDMEIEIELQ
jgi:hypothetical protein